MFSGDFISDFAIGLALVAVVVTLLDAFLEITKKPEDKNKH